MLSKRSNKETRSRFSSEERDMPRFSSLLALLASLLPAPLRAAEPVQTAVFSAGEGDYHTYRIPSVIVAPKGTVLAFCEGRKNGRGDTGDIDLLVKRSTDGGKTWGKTEV